MIQNTEINQTNDRNHHTISKSRFKFLIDQIQNKLNQSHSPTDHDESYISSSSTFNLFKRNRMLPKYLKSSRPQTLDCKNQKKISVNLEFNKLLLQQKKKFVEHSPNDKDLLFNLPQINIESTKNQKLNKKDRFDQTSPRWRLKPKIIQKIMLLTESQQNNLFKRSKKWVNIDFNDQIKITVSNQVAKLRQTTNKIESLSKQNCKINSQNKFKYQEDSVTKRKEADSKRPSISCKFYRRSKMKSHKLNPKPHLRSQVDSSSMHLILTTQKCRKPNLDINESELFFTQHLL